MWKRVGRDGEVRLGVAVDLNARDRRDWWIQSGVESTHEFSKIAVRSRANNKENLLRGFVKCELWASRWTGGWWGSLAHGRGEGC